MFFLQERTQSGVRDATVIRMHRTDGMVSSVEREGDASEFLCSSAREFGLSRHVHRITVVREIGALALTLFDTQDDDSGIPRSGYTRARRTAEAFFFAHAEEFTQAEQDIIGRALHVAALVEEGPFSVFRRSQEERKEAALALLGFLVRVPSQVQLSLSVLCAGMQEAY